MYRGNYADAALVWFGCLDVTGRRQEKKRKGQQIRTKVMMMRESRTTDKEVRKAVWLGGMDVLIEWVPGCCKVLPLFWNRYGVDRT